MAKLIVFLAIVVLLTFAAIMVAKAVRTAVQKHQTLPDKEWELQVTEAFGETRFALVKGHLRDPVGEIDRLDEHYSQKFTELQAKCENMIIDRNTSWKVMEITTGK